MTASRTSVPESAVAGVDVGSIGSKAADRLTLLLIYTYRHVAA
jgi:hypothetical protein